MIITDFLKLVNKDKIEKKIKSSQSKKDIPLESLIDMGTYLENGQFNSRLSKISQHMRQCAMSSNVFRGADTSTPIKPVQKVFDSSIGKRDKSLRRASVKLKRQEKNCSCPRNSVPEKDLTIS